MLLNTLLLGQYLASIIRNGCLSSESETSVVLSVIPS